MLDYAIAPSDLPILHSENYKTGAIAIGTILEAKKLRTIVYGERCLADTITAVTLITAALPIKAPQTI